jgi:hypothetical protein
MNRKKKYDDLGLVAVAAITTFSFCQRVVCKNE